MCLGKDIIAQDSHTQVGLCVDFILKNSLIRQTLDNITCVMLFFEGFEKIFNEHKSFYSGNTESKLNDKSKTSSKEASIISKINNSRGSQSSTSEDKSDRKIKTANGMIKKGSLLLPKNQAMSSSLISNEVKDKDKPISSQQSGMNSTFNYKSQAPTLNKTLINQQYDSSSKVPRELNEYVSNVPSTTKNNKSKISLFQNKNL
jgi:hypothetical protein